MKLNRVFPFLLLAGALAACGDDTSGGGGSGGGSGGGTTASTTTSASTSDASTTTGATTTATTTSSTGEGGAGGGGQGGAGGNSGPIAPVCEGVALPPDNAAEGSCIAIDGAAVQCNPVTNEGCDGGACDIGQADDGSVAFVCYGEAGTESACDFCNELDTFCNVGMSCTYYFFPQTPNIEQACAKYCCEDSECGDGICQPFDPEYGLPGGLCLAAPIP